MNCGVTSFLNILKRHHSNLKSGFTIVELLVVIVVIGVLASITILSYNGIQDRAYMAKIRADLTMLSKAVQSARESSQKTLGQLSGSYYSAGTCFSKANDTDLAALARTDSCWTNYLSVLNSVSNASGVNVRNMVDPWGRPYAVDENEGEGGGCGKDSVRVFAQPFVTNGSYAGTTISIPLSGVSGCAT